MKSTLSKYLKLSMCGILCISAICANNKAVNAAETATLNNNNEELIVSMYAEDKTSNMIKLNPVSKEYSEIVSNKEVWLSGNLTDDKSTLVYMNAIGQETWQVFSLDLKNKITSKLTTDNVGKFNGKAGKDNIVYFEVFDKSTALAKIEKYNTKDHSSFIFDAADKDRNTEEYDVRNDKIIAVMCSNSENEKRRKEPRKGHTPERPITYSIYEMNTDGSNMKQIADVNASEINSISYNYDCKKAIINGENINNDNGIYAVSIENGQITKVLTDNMINSDKNSIISDIGKTNAVLSKDGQTLYFAGSSKSVGEMLFSGITSIPKDIYSYDLKNNKITEVYGDKKHTIITDLTISY